MKLNLITDLAGMYNFILRICFLLLISFKSYALIGDVNVALRCDETYSLYNLCFPPDAELQPDGSCKCPKGGCAECPVVDGMQDYYCHTPINILNKFADRTISTGFKAVIRLHYEPFAYPNACGALDEAPLHCGTVAAWGLGVGALACLAMDDEKYGWDETDTIKVKFDTVESDADNLTDEVERTDYSYEKVFKSAGKTVGPNDYYAIQPRLEFVDQDGEVIPVVRFYFTQGDKHDKAQITMNIGSESQSTSYFDFHEYGFSDVEVNSAISDGDVWRAIKLCEQYDDDSEPYILTDDSPEEGVECYNSPFFKGLLMDTDDPSKGFRLPPGQPEPFYPTTMSYHAGGAFKMVSPPTITWELGDNATFINPVITVTFNDATSNSLNSTKEIDELEEDFNHTHETVWRYQLAMKIEESDNMQKQKQLCLYACRMHVSGSYCLSNSSIPVSGNRSITEYITLDDDSDRKLAKSIFLIEHNASEKCISLPEISNSNSIEITGLGIGSTYDDPKIKLKITENGKTTEETIYSIGTKQDIQNIVNVMSHSFPYLNNNESKSLLTSHAFTIRQELELSVAQSKLGPSCDTDDDCVTGYSCVNDKCSAGSDFKLCQLYHPVDPGTNATYFEVCDDKTIASVSEDSKSFMCLHNTYPINYTDNIKTHPYNIDSSIIKNDYIDFQSGASKNLCIPTPRKIVSFSHHMEPPLNKDNPKSDILLTYRDPKPFTNYDADDFDILLSADEGTLHSDQVIVNNYTKPASGSPATSKEVRFDYHNNFKFFFENNDGIYCIYVKKYNYSNNSWEASGLDGVGGLTVSGDKYKIGCTNLNFCPAGVLDGVYSDKIVLRSDMPETAANTNNILGSCTVNSTTCPDCTTPKANCDTYGKWQVTAGLCVNTCPAQEIEGTHDGKDYDFSFPITVANDDTNKSVTGSVAECPAGFTGVIEATASCKPDGSWGSITNTKNECTRLKCNGSASYTKSGVEYTFDVSNLETNDDTTIKCKNYDDAEATVWYGDSIISYFGTHMDNSVTITCNNDLSLSINQNCKYECQDDDGDWHDHGDNNVIIDEWEDCCGVDLFGCWDPCDKKEVGDCDDGSWDNKETITEGDSDWLW